MEMKSCGILVKMPEWFEIEPVKSDVNEMTFFSFPCVGNLGKNQTRIHLSCPLATQMVKCCGPLVDTRAGEAACMSCVPIMRVKLEN